MSVANAAVRVFAWGRLVVVVVRPACMLMLRSLCWVRVGLAMVVRLDRMVMLARPGRERRRLGRVRVTP